MRLSALHHRLLVLAVVAVLLPSFSTAFAPQQQQQRQHASLHSPLFRPPQASLVSEPDALHDLSDNVSKKLETVMEKADDLVLKRAMVSTVQE
jgi:hypothetical protein